MIAPPPNIDSEIEQLIANLVEYQSKMRTLTRSYIVQIEMHRKLIETSATELLHDLENDDESTRNAELDTLMHQLNSTNDIIDASQILDSIVDNIRTTIDNNPRGETDLQRLEKLYTNELEMQSTHIIECSDRLQSLRNQSTDAIQNFTDHLDSLTFDATNTYRQTLVQSFHTYRFDEAKKLISSISSIYKNAADDNESRWRSGAATADEHSRMIAALQLEVARRQVSITSGDMDAIDREIEQIKAEIDRLQVERSMLKRNVAEEMKRREESRSCTEMVLTRCRLEAKRRRLEQKHAELYDQIEFRLKYCNK